MVQIKEFNAFNEQLNIWCYEKGTCINPYTWVSELNLSTITEYNKEDVIVSVNPFTQEELSHIFPCDAHQYEKVIQESISAQKIWAKVPAPKRGDIIRQIGNELRKHKVELGNLITLEMGKIKSEGEGEVQEMIDMADFAVGQSRMLYGKSMHSERPEHRMFEQWHPLGVVGIITAFNFPMAVWAWNAFIAAICGNTAVWKPSSKTPLCAIAVQKICNRVLIDNNLPAIFNMFIPNNKGITEEFVKDPRINLLSFTGSTKIGKWVSEKVSKRMGKSLLELGGNNAVIVTENANLDLAIPAIVFGAVGTTGQRCTSTRRLFVHESIYDLVLGGLKKAYSQIKMGNPLHENVHMGPLIDQSAVDMYHCAIADARCDDSFISCWVGGKVAYNVESVGWLVHPVIIEWRDQPKLIKNEVFAPILHVMKYSKLEDAIDMQNDAPQGLSSAIFTDNVREMEIFLSSVGSDCGIANINIGTSGAEIGGAFGGEKETGGGREAGSDSWKQYMRRQTSTVNWGRALPLAQGVKFEI